MINENLTLFCTTTFGLEAVARRELESLGYEIDRVDDGRVFFSGNMSDVARTNLWLRSAERVMIQLAEFEAREFEELYQGVYSLDWPNLLPKNGNFVINGKSVRSTLYSIRHVQSISERAIIDKLQTVYDVKWFEKSGALYDIEIALLNDIVSINLDTSGRGLHRRGYRDRQSQAPIKETLASALVQLSYWNPDRQLLDLFCGTGTILIEGAMIGKNMAPGLYRSFSFNNWAGVDHDILRDEKSRAKEAINDKTLDIVGVEIDPHVVEMSNANIKKLGLEDDITVHLGDFRDYEIDKEYGVLISNPPYGERIADLDVERLEKDLGRKMKSHKTWSNYIITSDENFEQNYGKRADRKRKLFNGAIKTDYYQYYGPRPPR